MFSEKKRQQSLRQLPHIRKSSTFTGEPKVLPTISEIKQAKKNNTKDLTQVISKFTVNNQKQSLKNSQQLIRCAISVLRGFSLTQNNFQNLFTQLYSTMKRFCFVIDDPQIEKILVKYRVKLGFSFRQTCIMLDNQLQNVMKDKNEKISQLIEKQKVLRNQLQIKQTKWIQKQKFLQSEVERYKKLADIEYMKSLQQKVQYLTNVKQQLQLQCAQITKQNDQYLKQLDSKQTLVHDQAYQIAKLKSQLFDVRLRVQNDQIYLHKMRDRFDELLVKMMGIKQVIAKVQEQNNMLVSQRMKMVNRAAVAFQQLTPRPKYHDIIGISLRAHINSTQEIFQNLIGNSGLQKKQVAQKIVLKRKNSKLQEAEAVRDKVVDNIILAKKQMDTLQKTL